MCSFREYRVAFEWKLEGGEGIDPSVFGRKDHRVMEMAGAMGSEPGGLSARTEK